MSMHLEILVEELSSSVALENLLPKLVTGENSYRIITYQGKQDLLKKLPNTLIAYSRWISNNIVIVILVDLDKDNCKELKEKIEKIAYEAGLIPRSIDNVNYNLMIRIAIEELEAWFLGDPEAIRSAFPKVSSFEKNKKYSDPDSLKNSWEELLSILQRHGYYKTGLRKIEAADKISFNMQPLRNKSKSFSIFWSGIDEILNR